MNESICHLSEIQEGRAYRTFLNRHKGDALIFRREGRTYIQYQYPSPSVARIMDNGEVGYFERLPLIASWTFQELKSAPNLTVFRSIALGESTTRFVVVGGEVWYVHNDGGNTSKAIDTWSTHYFEPVDTESATFTPSISISIKEKKKKPIEVKLNPLYSALVTAQDIKVGCQTFPHSIAADLQAAVEKVKSKNN